MFCHLNHEFQWWYFEGEEYFLEYFNQFNQGTDRWIVALYYSFTSLSTIGLGDFNPRSDSERLVCSFLLLFGVAIFSYIIGTLMEIIDTVNSFNKEPGDSEALELNRFISVFENLFNHGREIDETLKNNIRAHFSYRWDNDKNFIIQSSNDKAIFDQLPMEVQTNIYAGFIYYDFLSAFEGTFYIEKPENEYSSKENSFYTWNDSIY